MTSDMWRCATSTSPGPIRKDASVKSTAKATHLIKRGVQTALGLYPNMEIFGQDYPNLGRDLCARLHPGYGLDRCASGGACLPSERPGEHGLQLRLCPRSDGQGGCCDVVKKVSGVDFKVLSRLRSLGRSSVHCRAGRSGEEPARMEAGSRQPYRHRATGARLGAQAEQPSPGRQALTYARVRRSFFSSNLVFLFGGAPALNATIERRRADLECARRLWDRAAAGVDRGLYRGSDHVLKEDESRCAPAGGGRARLDWGWSRLERSVSDEAVVGSVPCKDKAGAAAIALGNIPG